jgi:nitroimidazol reductase NimA-like FMN-containing flavoprotein (pyridoxamine 5'-phosphate oxidase superfamily)
MKTGHEDGTMSEAQPGIATAPSPRTKIKRGPTRARYGNDEVLAILADGLVCHVGTIVDGHPAIIPTAYAVVDGELCIHGSTANRILRALRDGAEACVTVTHLDGLVMARSAFHHSVNYRSVVIYGHAREVTDPGEKVRALGLLVDHFVPGRSAAVRAPNREELLRTMVLMVPLDEASAKVRSGPPVDDEADYGLDVWAGEIPLRTVASAAIADDRTSLPISIEVTRKVRELA